MSVVAWPSVLAVAAWELILVVVTLASLYFIVRRVVRATVKAEMERAVQAMSRRLDASEVYLTAAEQHTALQQDWEQKRHADHERRQKENIQMLQRLIQSELDKRLKAATATVVSEVKAVPEATAEKVIEKATDPTSGLHSFKQPGTGDSHHG